MKQAFQVSGLMLTGMLMLTLFSFENRSHGGEATGSNQSLDLDGPGWLLATDPKNTGREEKWFTAPHPEAVATHIPWIIQDAFPAYHGVATN